MTASTDATGEQQDDLEGFDSGPHGLDTYPLDSLLIRTEQRAIVDVLRRIEKGTIKLDPDFQRDFVWDRERQSRLIESILMRIPLPVFYVAEDSEGKLVVVDGLQRLTTLRHFGSGNLTLELSNPELRGVKIDGLSAKLRGRFEDGQILFYIIDAKAPERVRLDIFDRVNSGVPLTRQQMRNALYSGPATALLRELVAAPDFEAATEGALAKDQHRRSQRDREVINRFLAFHVLGVSSYDRDKASDMDEFLARALQTVNRDGQIKRDSDREAFLRSMRSNRRVFGRLAFRKHRSASDRKNLFNVALFEVFSVVFARYAESMFPGREEDLRQAFYRLLDDHRFTRAISATTTAPESVTARFELAGNAVRGVLGDP